MSARGYRLAARLAAAYLRRGLSGAAVYLRHGVAAGDVVPAVSDLDLAVVVPDDPAGGLREHERAKRRWRRVTRRLPRLRGLIHDLAVYEQWELEDASSAPLPTYGLGPSERRPAAAAAAVFGARPSHDEAELRSRPGLLGPAHDWRLLSGPERRPPRHPPSRQEQRIAAWLETQFCWRLAFHACANADRPWAAHMCVKMVAEPARTLLLLAGKRPPERRAEVLAAAARELPEHADACARALQLLRALPRSPQPPLPEFIGELSRLSARIARLIGDEISAEGTREVRLLGLEPDAPAVPLADWRAVVVPALPGEALQPFEGPAGDPDPATLVAAAGATGPRVQPVLSHGELLLLPNLAPWSQGILRSVQAPFSDPVSIAVLAGRRTAAFPEVEGWVARDWARRAVAEHAAWLRRGPDTLGAPTLREWIGVADPTRLPARTRALAKLLTALRAGLFLDSFERGEPELALTVGAAARSLSNAGHDPHGRSTEAAALFDRAEPGEPEASLLEAMDTLVRSMPAYAAIADGA